MVRTVVAWLFLVKVTHSMSSNSTKHESTLAVDKTNFLSDKFKIVSVIVNNFRASIIQKNTGSIGILPKGTKVAVWLFLATVANSILCTSTFIDNGFGPSRSKTLLAFCRKLRRLVDYIFIISRARVFKKLGKLQSLVSSLLFITSK